MNDVPAFLESLTTTRKCNICGHVVKNMHLASKATCWCGGEFYPRITVDRMAIQEANDVIW